MSTISLTVNGIEVVDVIDDRTTLADFLRDHLNLTGTHLACEHGVCGACTVLVDEVPIRACITLALSVAGKSAWTERREGSWKLSEPETNSASKYQDR